MKTSRLVLLASGMAACGVAACATSESDPSVVDTGVVPDGANPDGASGDGAVGDPPLAGDRLRLVAGNLTTGNNQAYEQPGIRIFRGLAADVAMIQEFNVASGSAAELRSFVDQAFGTGYVFARAVSGQIPNGIVSRYPIIASGEWVDTEVGNRDFVWAQIDIPGPTDLFAISVHLLSTSVGERNIEAGELVQRIGGLPAGAFVALGGDFNTASRTEACIQTLSSVLVTTGGFPVDQANVANTNANRNKPYDWVLANPGLQALKTDVVIGARTFADGFVADTRVYTPIADLAPALASDSGASNMQHMAVVRDFALPSAGPPPAARVVINEVLANEPGADTSGELVELVNRGSGAADLSGWTISDATAVRHVFAAGTTLAAGRAVVVFAGAAGIPPGLGNAVASSTGSLSLGNSGDTVKLASPAGPIDSVTYTSTLASSDGVSMNRSPDGDPTGAFVLHTTLSAAPRSPGTRVDGAAF